MQDSMIFYSSFYQAIKELDLPTQAEIYNAIFAYALEEKEPEELSTMASVIFTLIKPQIDANIQRRENGKKGAKSGKKGGRPRKENTIVDNNKNPIGVIEENPIRLEEKTPKGLSVETPNVNDNVNVNVNDNVNENANDNLNVRKKVSKKENAEKIIAMYNTQCPSLPKAITLTDARIKSVNARLKDYTEDEIETAFVKAENSSFLRGEKGEWKADFDWLMNPNNIVKVLEGKYDNKEQSRLSVVDNW